MTEPLVYLRSRFLPQSQAHLTLHDAGFVMGATVSDLCRTFRHQLFRLPDHIARFVESCRLARIPLQSSLDDLSQIALELTSHNCRLIDPAQDLALVMCATPGPLPHYLGETQSHEGVEPTLLMHTYPIPIARYAHFFEHGVHLITPWIRQVSPTAIDPRIKHRSRLNWWIAGHEVQTTDPDALALLTDDAGRVTETTIANFLIVRDEYVVSPPSDTVLPGISLRTVRELCGELQIPFREQPLTLTDCLAADEALITGTSFCLAGVSILNGSPLPWPGKIFERLMTKWSDLIGLDIRRQFLPNR